MFMELNIVNMSLLPKFIYTSKQPQSEISTEASVENDKKHVIKNLYGKAKMENCPNIIEQERHICRTYTT